MAPNLLKLLVPEVGIPSINSGQAHRHGVKTLLKVPNDRELKKLVPEVGIEPT